MASMCLSITTAKTLAMPFPAVSPSSTSSSLSTSTAASRHTCRLVCCRCSLVSTPAFGFHRGLLSNSGRTKRQVVRMAPDEERLTRRNPLDFPVEWERPRPGRRPDIFPQFSPMKTPLPPPLPYDPPEEDEEEEEKKEEEEDPEKEEQEQPEN